MVLSTQLAPNAPNGEEQAGMSRRQLVLAGLTTPILIISSNAAYAQDSNAQELLRRSDQARGGGLPGLAWAINLNNSGTGMENQPSMFVRVEATVDASLAVVERPEKSKDSKMLQVRRNMWLKKPDLSKPVPISPRQRLSGVVAVGDIAATNYAREYNATIKGEDSVRGEACYVLDLQARGKGATYDRIEYWVSKSRSVAVKATFLSLSGKPLKYATYTHGNQIDGSIAFISYIAIADALTDARSTLSYSNIEIRSIPAARFNPDLM
jgi:Outer membrane lipoprotein-sorting protein